jgi:hypothetical protein
MRANRRKKKGDIHSGREGAETWIGSGVASTGECGKVLFPPKKKDGEKWDEREEENDG